MFKLKLKRLLKVLMHPVNCNIDECNLCAILDCPNNTHEHYWHDGCPTCWTLDTNGYKSNYLKKDSDVQA